MSIEFAKATFLLFSCRDVSDDGTKVLMNLCVALIISYVIFLAGITQTENEVRQKEKSREVFIWEYLLFKTKL